MATHYHIDTDEELVSFRVEGETSIDDLQAAAEALTELDGYRSDWRHLVDLRDMRLELDSEETMALIEQIGEQCRSRIAGAIAIVVSPELEPLTCANIFHVTCTVDATELFDDYALAIKWLYKNGFGRLPPEPEAGPDQPDHDPEQVRA